MNKPNSNVYTALNQMSDEELMEIGLVRVSALEVRITKILHMIGIPAHIKGYQYVRTAIFLCVKKPNTADLITKELYPTIAKEYNTTNSRVERAIRHAIEVAWDRGDTNIQQAIFGYTIQSNRGKPTNGEFIAMISDGIRMNMLDF